MYFFKNCYSKSLVSGPWHCLTRGVTVLIACADIFKLNLTNLLQIVSEFSMVQSVRHSQKFEVDTSDNASAMPQPSSVAS